MLIDINEAEKRTGIPSHQWARWAEVGRIPSTQPGGPGTKVYLAEEVVERAIAQATSKPVKPAIRPGAAMPTRGDQGGGVLQPEAFGGVHVAEGGVGRLDDEDETDPWF